jgi:hypothetical protein
MIKHMVFFSLHYAKGSAEVKQFFEGAATLTAIEGVQHFESLLQTSKKNDFQYGLSMEFENEAVYKAYNNHPLHVAFIQQYWIPGVAAFMEIDHVPLVL